MLSDLRQALRQLARSPGFTAVAVLTLALGLGASTAVYSVAEAVVFRPLPFKDESSLVWIWSTRTDRDKAFFSIPDFEDFRRESRTVADAAALTTLAVNLTGPGEPERVSGARMTANLFPLLGISPAAGRLPQASDDEPGAAPVAVLGHAFWQRRFGGDPAVVGRVVTLNGVEHTLVGVLPPAFVIPNFDTDIVVAQSLANDPRRAERGTNFLRVVARLRPGISPAQAQAEWAALVARNAERYPATNAKQTAPRFLPLRDELVGDYRAALLTLLAAAGLLLLILCANLAGLLLARGLGRARETAVRAALGASPARLVRLFLAEGLVLTGAGGMLGVLAAWWALDGLVAIAPPGLPRAAQVALDGRAVGFAIAVTFLVGAAVSLLPAMRIARTDPGDALKSGSGGATRRGRMRSVLVAAQIALSVTLLVGAGLLMRSLHRVLAADPGFTPANVLTLQVALPGAHYGAPVASTRFAEALMARLAALPGVQSVGLTSAVPLTGINARADFLIESRPPPKPADLPGAQNRYVSEGYFETLRVPLLRGRAFTAHDDATGAPVVIIDEALARRFWPGENPLGQKIRIDDSGAAPRAAEIVGVVGSVKHFSLDETPLGTLYTPFRQLPRGNLGVFNGRLNFTLRLAAPKPGEGGTAGDPLAPAVLARRSLGEGGSRVEGLAESARRAVHALDADVPVTARPLAQALAWTVAPREFNVHLMGFFAATALLLATLGLYAVAAQSVTLRTREIGVRLALGADRARIARLVLGEGARVALAGIATGLAVSLVGAQFLRGLLYATDPADPLTFAVVAAVLLVVALLASWLPARRATRVNPLDALRAE